MVGMKASDSLCSSSLKHNTMTNEKALKSLLKQASPVQLALLRERILTIMDITEQGIKENPDAWSNPFVHSSEYLLLKELVDKTLGFDN
jgi:hypothetical protein